MKVIGSLVERLTPAARRAAHLLVFSAALACGCAEQAVEERPQDVEKARQEHIEMMQRESGQTTPEKG